jgi:hypothetical protein
VRPGHLAPGHYRPTRSSKRSTLIVLVMAAIIAIVGVLLIAW